MDVVGQAMRDEAADYGMTHEQIDEVAEMDAYYESLAQMERERHGIPEGEPTIPQRLDALRGREAAFRAEVRSHRRMANGVLRGFLRPSGGRPVRTYEEERIEALGWGDGPMVSEEDFTPEAL